MVRRQLSSFVIGSFSHSLDIRHFVISHFVGLVRVHAYAHLLHSAIRMLKSTSQHASEVLHGDEHGEEYEREHEAVFDGGHAESSP